MKKEYKDKFPKWADDKKIYYMCLSDDLDSLFSCILLQKIKGYEISHFYSFNKLYKGNNYNRNNYKLVGVDIDFTNYKCWGNHVTNHHNPNSCNLNVVDNINRSNYFTKYGGSTLLQIISYYNIDISNLSEEAKMIILCIDSSFLGFYSNYPQPRMANKKYLCDVLELEELYKLQETHSKEEFEELTMKYNLKKKIFVNEDGKLKTGINLGILSQMFNLCFDLPKNDFEEIREFEDVGINILKYNSFVEELGKQNKKIFTQAQTNRDFVKLSYY